MPIADLQPRIEEPSVLALSQQCLSSLKRRDGLDATQKIRQHGQSIRSKTQYQCPQQLQTPWTSQDYDEREQQHRIVFEGRSYAKKERSPQNTLPRRCPTRCYCEQRRYHVELTPDEARVECNW